VLALRGRPWRALGRAQRAALASTLEGSLARWRQNALGYALPFFALYLPYFAWRAAYYGDLFPNTYYAKSGSDWHLAQGLTYVWISGLASGAWALVPLALLGIWRYRASLIAQFTLLAIPIYLVYVIKIGGDFMLGRLLCPALPLVFVVAELGLMTLLFGRGRWKPALGLACVPLFAFAPTRVKLIDAWDKYHGLADERTYYALKTFDPVLVDSPYTDQATALRDLFASAVRLPSVGVYCVGIIGYVTSMPLLDYFGLTDPVIARKKIKARGRPGHEKVGTIGDAVRADADFAEEYTYPEPYSGYTRLDFGIYHYYLAKYDSALIEPLRQAGRVSVGNFEKYLRQSRKTRNKRRLACDTWFLSTFYFRANPRERAEQQGERALAQVSAQLPPRFRDWVIYGDSPLDAGFRPLTRWSFEESLSPDWTRSGDAFDGKPRREALAGQQPVLGQEGGFMTSYHVEREDAATGELRSPRVVLQGDALTLRVGGGFSRRLAVRLLVDDRAVLELTGCDSEMMYRWAWDISAYRGHTAQIAIVDESEGSWGHIAVDEIIEWQGSGAARNEPLAE
jgi:hypothetical protein